ncbi:MAG: hypothetical protein KF858_10410 [Candidatus Sumerlaeia bacterium]|nr:hypothetical protein [Candidatus Sumerlaeia bacterium]
MGTIAAVWMLALAGTANPQGGSALYIADDYAGAIYAQDLAQPGTPPELVTGKTAFQAEVAVLLSATESVFVPTPGQDWIHYLYHVDHATGAKQLLHTFGRFDRILAMDADDDSNGVTVLLQRDRSLLLVRSVRPSTTEPWTTAEPFVVRTSASIPPTGDVLRLEENLYAIHFLPEPDGNNLRLYAVGDDGVTTSTLSTPPPHTAGRFARSDTGEWLLYRPNVAPSEEAAPFHLFDASNQQVDLTEEPAHPLFQQRLQAVEWRHSLDGLTAVTPTGIWSADEPLTDNPQAAEVFSFMTDGRPDPLKDLSGSTEVLQLSAEQWRVFNRVLGQVRDVDATTGVAVPKYTHQRGSGPELIEIRDLLVGPAGTIFVLDGPPRGQRIVRVDPATGDRAIIFAIPADTPAFERFLRRPDGSFLLAARKIDTPGKASPTASLFEAVPTPNGPAPYAIAHIDSPFYMPPILGLARHPGNGHEYALLNPIDAMQVARLEGGQLVARPNLEVVGSTFSETPGIPSGRRGNAKATYPDTHPARSSRLLVRIVSTQTRWDAGELRIFAPNDATNLFALVTAPGLYDTIRIDNVVTRDFQAILDTSSLESLRGEWRVFTSDFVGNRHGDNRLSLVARPAPTARHMRIASDGTFWLLQSNPPQLSTWNDETGDVIDLPYTFEPGLGLPQEIRHAPADLVLSPDGSSAYISYLERSVIVGVNLTDGSTWIQSPGRPVTMDERFLGLEGAAHFRLAVGPTIDASKGSRWIVQGVTAP